MCEGMVRLQVALESAKIRRDQSRAYSVPVSLAARYSPLQQVTILTIPVLFFAGIG